MTAATATPGVADPPPGDAVDGNVMFVIFTAAVLCVTGAVALIAFVNTWWMLGAGFAFHVAMTTIVCVTIARAMSDRDRSIRSRRAAAH